MQLFFPELPKIAFSPSAAAPRGNNFEVAHYAALPSLATTATATATTMLEIWRETEAQAAVEIEDGERDTTAGNAAEETNRPRLRDGKI